MINLYIPISIDCDNFDINDIEWIVSNKEEFIVPYMAMKEEYPLPRISIQLCKWYEYKDYTYISVYMLVNLNDINEFSLRVNEGVYCDTNERIVETDGFVDIKTDIESIQKAITDIKNKRIPLINRVKSIDYQEYPYIVEYDD